jgi:hypothetical protein
MQSSTAIAIAPAQSSCRLVMSFCVEPGFHLVVLLAHCCSCLQNLIGFPFFTVLLVGGCAQKCESSSLRVWPMNLHHHDFVHGKLTEHPTHPDARELSEVSWTCSCTADRVIALLWVLTLGGPFGCGRVVTSHRSTPRSTAVESSDARGRTDIHSELRLQQVRTRESSSFAQSESLDRPQRRTVASAVGLTFLLR